jgi:ABC-type branched-subunit amino acid transport system substrate-binding protein
MVKLKYVVSSMLLFYSLSAMAVLDVKMHYVGSTDGSAWLGVQQGIDEANLQGMFLGQNYSITATSAAELAASENVTAVLVSADVDTVLNLAKMPELANVAIFNLTATDDVLRQVCLPNLFNVTASEQMRADALAQWEQKHPDQVVTVQGWHESFKKFAASQLNKRFKKAHNVIMDDDSWAGWVGPKMVADTVARIQSAEAKDILKFVKNELAFDGQKGAGATFRENGQLRQLLLLVDENNKIAAEAPLRGVKGGLDSLGNVACK